MKKKTFPFKAENAYEASDLGPFCSWSVDVNSPRTSARYTLLKELGYTLCENIRKLHSNGGLMSQVLKQVTV